MHGKIKFPATSTVSNRLRHLYPPGLQRFEKDLKSGKLQPPVLSLWCFVGFFKPSQRLKITLPFEIVPQVFIAVGRELSDGGIQPGGCGFKAFEVCLRVAIAELMVGNDA
ncbi:MAG TPA: hypothetical protein VIT00_01455 [Terrimicrobiaceae bacterium]